VLEWSDNKQTNKQTNKTNAQTTNKTKQNKHLKCIIIIIIHRHIIIRIAMTMAAAFFGIRGILLSIPHPSVRPGTTKHTTSKDSFMTLMFV
jgi:hypothetical protein